jgi:transposase
MEINWEELLNISELKVTAYAIEKHRIYLSCCATSETGICPSCLKKCNSVVNTYRREIRDSAICGKELYLRLDVRQFVCATCNTHFSERFSFVEASQQQTKRYQSRLFDLCKGADIQYVARQENLHWNVVNRIFQVQAMRMAGLKKEWKRVRHLGIDEISLLKGHKNYVVVLVDLESGVVLDILPERSKAYLKTYFLSKGEIFCAQIQTFCSDMWEGFVNCAKEVFPQAEVVVDRFHFFAYLQKALDKCRQSLRRKFEDKEELKSLRWLLLKPAEQVNENEKKQLKQVFEQVEYQRLETLWNARNDFRTILETPCSPQQAEQKIEDWQKQYSQSPNPHLEKFIKFYQTWKIHILNYFSKRFTTSLIEGINNKLKLIKRRAYGFLDFNAFRLRAIVEFCPA